MKVTLLQCEFFSENTEAFNAKVALLQAQLLALYDSLVQGSKLGWSCGPSLPKLLSDHQIVLGGGPVVYWKTHHKRTVFF